jgi:hypothetical protein
MKGQTIIGANQGPPPRAAQTSDAELDEVVNSLEELRNERTLDMALAVGELLVNRVYGGVDELSQFGSRHTVYRRFLRRPGLTLSPTTLWRSMRVYELCHRMPWLKTAPRIKLSHIYAVLGVQHSAQSTLLARAHQEGWTTEQLAERAAHQKPTEGRRGRPSSSPCSRLVQRISSAAKMMHRVSETMTEVSEAESVHLEQAVSELREIIAAMERLRTPSV